MTLDLSDCCTSGPALPEPFLHLEFADLLQRLGLLPPRDVERHWNAFRQQLMTLGRSAGPLRVCNHLLGPLASCLGYAAPVRQDPVATREGEEDGGWLLQASDIRLRCWTIGIDTDLDAPARSGRAYRFSPTRRAQRVLRASGERLGLLTNGDQLRLLFCEPSRPDSHLTIRLAAWRTLRDAPDGFRCLLGLASPAGVCAMPEILEAARLNQVRITKELRVQARAAIEGFLQSVLDHPDNAKPLAKLDPTSLPAVLWQQALVVIYRLLFILKLENATDPARAFSFSGTQLWRQALSPARALAVLVRRHLDQGHDTGRLLQDGLRTLFHAFRDGLCCSELSVAPLGGALFGAEASPLLDRLAWSERGVALLLDRLLWTSPRNGVRERVHYGSLDVEELGQVYEALLELEPGIAATPMLRLRRARLETVVPADQHRRAAADSQSIVEQIPAGRFFLRAGLGRKATGAYYTPHDFVRFLVRETLAPQVASRSPDDDPDPASILSLRVVDPATGSGHFLVEACRFLGDALYAACRACDEQASAAEAAAVRAEPAERERLLQGATLLRQRLTALPDADGILLSYLPSRACDGCECGLSEARATAFCRRLIAVHCLYGADRNALAIELAKVSLWLESYAEGLPLTFLDHRLLVGDSIGGPFFAQLSALPVSRKPLVGIVSFGITERLDAAVTQARREVQALEASVGRDAADLVVKQAAKRRLDTVLAPLRRLASAWSGAAMLGNAQGDEAWLALSRHVAQHGAWPERLTGAQVAIAQAGKGCLPWDLTFPEVFASDRGFDAVLSNPPWDVLQYSTRDFIAGYDLRVLDAPTKQERALVERRVLADPACCAAFTAYKENFSGQKRLAARLYRHQKVSLNNEFTAGNLDTFRLFAERMLELAGADGRIGMLVPSAFHANEGATGLRQLYLERAQLECCFSFENRRKLFDIDSRFKFALIVARVPGPTRKFRCAFYLDALEQIEDATRALTYDRAFLEVAGGTHLAFPELRSRTGMQVAQHLFTHHRTLGDWCGERGISFGCDLHMTADSAQFMPIGRLLRGGETIAGLNRRGYLPLHEGKTFHQFTDQWDTPPRYAVSAEALLSKPATRAAARHYRLVFRDVARSSDERTLIAAIMPPGVVCGHTANTERTPGGRPVDAALLLCALLNSFPLDWAVRQRAAAHLSIFIVQALPVPGLTPDDEHFLVEAALRLSCNHPGYAALWRDEHGDRRRWPVLNDTASRWRLRAMMDAVIARGFGLDRAAYHHVLSGFSHRSYPDAPALCLAAFDTLHVDGNAVLPVVLDANGPGISESAA